MGAYEDALQKRIDGSAKTGTVGIRDFDLGVVKTLGAEEYTDPSVGPTGTFIPEVPGVCPPDGMPGVPVVFAFPEDVITNYKQPVIVVRRDDISPANERWHPSGLQYRAPGAGAVPFVVTVGSWSKSGFDRMESLPQAIPFDITYTITVKGRYRGGGTSGGKSNRAGVDALFNYALRIFPPYGYIKVVDSIGDFRGYDAFNEGISNLDSTGDIQEREIGYAMSIRVEAELDLKDPITLKTVKVPLTVRPKQL